MAVSPTLRILSSPASLTEAACRRISEIINGALGERGICSAALAGGETPRPVYRLLAEEAGETGVDWKHVHLFFGDERLVPPDDPESNFGMAERELLSRIPIPAGNVRRIRGELPPDEAVEEYRRDLKTFFGSGAVRFDLILLGLGSDGHTASLFPGSGAVTETEASVVAVSVPGAKTPRATITMPVINNARTILFVVSGRSKAPIVRNVLAAAHPTPNLPATMVRPLSGELEWLIDSDAASEIRDETGTIVNSLPERKDE